MGHLETCLRTIATLSIFFMVSCSGSKIIYPSGSEQSSETKSEKSAADEDVIAEDEGTDVPVWINGTHLIGCSPEEVISVDRIDMNCYLTDQQKQPLKANKPATVYWNIKNEKGQESQAAELSVNPDETIGFVITMTVDEVLFGRLTMQVEANNSENVKTYTSQITESLLNRTDTPAFESCLAEKRDFVFCVNETDILTNEDQTPLPLQSHELFFTASEVSTNWGGMPENADQYCQTTADNENLGGVWVALLNFEDSLFTERHSLSGDLRNSKDEIIADSIANFIDGGPNGESNDIYDEKGRSYRAQDHGSELIQWGLKDQITFNSVDSCNNWNGGGSTYAGRLSNISSFWGGARNLTITDDCTTDAHLICIKKNN